METTAYSGPWRGWRNAELYQAFVHRERIYRWLNRQLIQRAQLDEARRVLDLGCGTGATTRAALAELPSEAEVVGVDVSLEMVEVATANTPDPRARFVVTKARDMAAVVRGPFDRVLSNAAFWQFEAVGEVLEAASDLLSPGGRLVLNMPADRQGDARGAHPFQLALARAVEERTGEPYRSFATQLEPHELESLACQHGLEPVLCEERAYHGQQGELMELMGIPAMLASVASSLPRRQAREALDEARSRCDPTERVQVPWWFLVYETAAS